MLKPTPAIKDTLYCKTHQQLIEICILRLGNVQQAIEATPELFQETGGGQTRQNNSRSTECSIHAYGLRVDPGYDAREATLQHTDLPSTPLTHKGVS